MVNKSHIVMTRKADCSPSPMRSTVPLKHSSMPYAALVKAGLVARPAGESLQKAYVFTRILVDGLRMVRGNTKDLVLPPPDSEEFVGLARRVGYTTDDWRAGARHLQSDITHHMKATSAFFTKTFAPL